MSDGNDKGKDKGRDDGIGFGRTPKYTRFKKGQSGNPNGRPKKEAKDKKAALILPHSEQDELLRSQLERKVSISEGGKRKKMKMREIISQAQINAAAKGNVYAQREVLKTARELELRDAERAVALAEQEQMKREKDALVYDYMVGQKAERTRIWAEAEARGVEPDEPWPHPDDILLFPESKRWRVRGPFDATDLTFFTWLRAERDYLYATAMQYLFNNKRRSRAWRDLQTLLWVSFDVRLPLRWQIAHNMDVEFFYLSILTKKQLQAEVDRREYDAKFMKMLAGVSDKWDKDSYKFANSIMKPFLKQKGYRSLAEFEDAYAKEGQNLSWPKDGGTLPLNPTPLR
jgi:hypothetical protein